MVSIWIITFSFLEIIFGSFSNVLGCFYNHLPLMFSIHFLIYLNIHILYSVSGNSKTPKSLGEIIPLLLILLIYSWWLFSSVSCDLFIYFFYHELVFLENFSKEILFRLGCFLFSSARRLKAVWAWVHCIWQLLAWSFSDYTNTVNLDATPIRKSPTYHEIRVDFIF